MGYRFFPLHSSQFLLFPVFPGAFDFPVNIIDMYLVRFFSIMPNRLLKSYKSDDFAHVKYHKQSG